MQGPCPLEGGVEGEVGELDKDGGGLVDPGQWPTVAQ